MEPAGERQQDISQEAVLEEIHDLLLQQRDKLVFCFQDCLSGYEEINHKLQVYKPSLPHSSKQDNQLLGSSDAVKLQYVFAQVNTDQVKQSDELVQVESKQHESCVNIDRMETQKESLRCLAHPKSTNGSQVSFAQDMRMWTKELELEELRDKEAANALCRSSRSSESHMATPTNRCCKMLDGIVHGFCFESFVSVAIMTNAMVIGVETQYMATSQHDDLPMGFKILGWLYGFIFLVELTLRITSEGCEFFKSHRRFWNLFDLFCVSCSLFEILVDAVASGNTLQNTNIVRITRMVRTLKLSRTIRISSVVRFVSALQILVQSIMATLKSLVWALLLMCMIVYICGIMFTQAATTHVIETKNEHELPDLLEYWGTLGTSMATLYQSVTGGLSWREAALPLSQLSWIWEFLFVAYVSFTYFAVLNVVTGVFCNSAIENARHEPDMVIQSLLSDQEWYEKHLKELFQSLDKDRSGKVSIRELEKSISKDSVRAWFAAMGLEISDAWTLFKLIDEDRSHDVSVQEFVTRCMQLKGNARSIDLALLRRDYKMMMKKVLEIGERMENHFYEDQAQLRRIGESMVSTSSTMTPVKHEETSPRPVPATSSPVAFLQTANLSM